MKTYTIIGVMSGSSMDGVDLACCVFTQQAGGWQYEITYAETIAYDETWKVRLSHLHKQPIHLYPKTDAFYGKYLGMLVNEFVGKYQVKPHLVASHGHTIFHQPAGGYTAQIGNGAFMYAETGIPVACDFRTVDIALGGQGAPLVPVGDELLFGAYEACLNLGGFSNISYRKNAKRIAYDIGPCNIILNRVANEVGKEFDDNGAIASRGKVHPQLLEQLNELPFFKLEGAKSLGREWVDETFWPIVRTYELQPEDLMATLCEQIAGNIAQALDAGSIRNMLVTGGGAFNGYLMQRITAQSRCEAVIPDPKLIAYKEALIFAFLGLLRIEGKSNVLSSVTGARADNMGGAIYGPLSFS